MVVLSRSQYSSSFKSEVISIVLSGQLSIGEARRFYGIKGHDTIDRWLYRYYLSEGGNILPGSSDDSGTDSLSVKELKRALEYARMENLILKKMIEIGERDHGITFKKKVVPKHPRDQKGVTGPKSE